MGNNRIGELQSSIAKTQADNARAFSELQKCKEKAANLHTAQVNAGSSGNQNLIDKANKDVEDNKKATERYQQEYDGSKLKLSDLQTELENEIKEENKKIEEAKIKQEKEEAEKAQKAQKKQEMQDKLKANSEKYKQEHQNTAFNDLRTAFSENKLKDFIPAKPTDTKSETTGNTSTTQTNITSETGNKTENVGNVTNTDTK